MKRHLYKVINRLGYDIQNKKKRRNELIKPLKKYQHLKGFNLLVQSKNDILNLENNYNDFNIKNHKQGFMVCFSGLKFYVESIEEFHILNEVFVNDDYRFTSHQQAILIDIGANIGITSLFFSKFNFIEKIFCFEPVKTTYEQAKYNFQLNSKICKVGSIKNIGLGKNNREEQFLFDSNIKGNTGIRGKLSPSYSKSTFAKEISVNIKEASIEITEILNTIKPLKVIVKMDCEGAEYEILENLFKTGVINDVDVFLLEWHDQGVERIEKIFKDSGFDFFSTRFSAIAGMIYAYKVVQ